ncbi:hypothetical protein [Flavobacterium sp. C4GT6]|uniref:hypothetical protein n=1 Tax=Flavobacterium sp. C4GT6 TaxID=3103818 RepID=UPI002ED6B782
MSKLTLEALRLRAEAVASNDLLETISGGTNNDCHDSETPAAPAPAAPPAEDKGSWELKANFKYDTKTGGTIIEGGVIYKF